MSKRCNICDGEFPVDDMVVFGDETVCAACKPVYVQGLREGSLPYPNRLFRKDRLLVIGEETELPNRCIFCNSSSRGSEKEFVLNYQPVWSRFLPLLLIAGFIIMERAIPGGIGGPFGVMFIWILIMVVSFVFSKKFKVKLEVCPQCRRRGRGRTWMFLSGCIVAMLIVIPIGLITGSKPFSLIAIILFPIVTVSYFILRKFQLSTKSVKDGRAYVKGACDAYLDALSELPGTRRV